MLPITKSCKGGRERDLTVKQSPLKREIAANNFKTLIKPLVNCRIKARAIRDLTTRVRVVYNIIEVQLCNIYNHNYDIVNKQIALPFFDKQKYIQYRHFTVNISSCLFVTWLFLYFMINKSLFVYD